MKLKKWHAMPMEKREARHRIRVRRRRKTGAARLLRGQMPPNATVLTLATTSVAPGQ